MSYYTYMYIYIYVVFCIIYEILWIRDYPLDVFTGPNKNTGSTLGPPGLKQVAHLVDSSTTFHLTDQYNISIVYSI